MKQILPLFLSLLITSLPLHLFSQPEFFGYYEGEVDQVKVGNGDYFFGYNKVRIDLESSTDDVTFWANMNIQLFHGRSKWNLFDFLPRRISEQLVTNGVDDFPFALRDTLYLDNAYLRVAFPRFDLVVGKQQISLGTGYAWNPLDIFNRKDLLDPTYEQTGVNAVRVEMPLADRFLLDAIVSPGEDWGSSARLVRGKVGVGRFDLVGTAGTFQWTRTGVNPDTFQKNVTTVDRKMLGWATVGEVLAWGVWTEGSWNMVNGEPDFPEYLLGFDHTFDFSTYLLAEYYHNGSGIVEQNSLHLGHYLSYFLGETHSLMQDYAFVFVNHPLTDLVTLGLFGIANLNDDSMAINQQLDWNMVENANLGLLFSYFRGDEDSEFGMQDWGIRLRLRAYF